jgi:hypothetical protein
MLLFPITLKGKVKQKKKDMEFDVDSSLYFLTVSGGHGVCVFVVVGNKEKRERRRRELF